MIVKLENEEDPVRKIIRENLNGHCGLCLKTDELLYRADLWCFYEKEEMCGKQQHWENTLPYFGGNKKSETFRI